jgi:glutamate racemase
MSLMRGNPRPLGIFDSGIGGFSVLREIRNLLPHESIVYVADHRFAPYGERTLGEVADRAIQISGQLIEADAKLVVVACNSASAAALHRLRDFYPDTPFVGMEPAVKPAALHSRTGVIGVLATAATFQGALFASVVDRHANGATIVPIVGSGLAEAVESGIETGPVVKALLRRHLSPALDAGMDTLVLGCTHYSFLGAAIATVAGDAVTVVDPAPAVARQVARLVTTHGLAAGPDGCGGLRLATTGHPDQLEMHAVHRLDLDEPQIHRW